MSEYNEYGYYADTMTYNFTYMLQPILRLLNKTKNTSILDLGCGNGFLVNHLISLGYNAYGIDASEDGIALAKRANPGNFFVHDLSSGSLPSQLSQLNFDTIISTEVIEHLYNPAGFIEHCKHILGPNGTIILTTPYHGYLKNLVISIFNKWDDHINPLWLGGHIKFWSKATLSKLLTDAGFIVTNYKGAGRIPYFWKSMIIEAKLN